MKATQKEPNVYLLEPPMRMWGQDHTGNSLYEAVNEVFVVECEGFGYPRVVIHQSLRDEDGSFGVTGQFARVMDGVTTKEQALSISGYLIAGAAPAPVLTEPV